MATIQSILESWAAHCLSSPEHAARVGGVVRVVVRGVSPFFVRLILKFPVTVSWDEGRDDCVISMTEDVVNGVVANQINLQESFSKGEIEVTGDSEVALKFSLILASHFDFEKIDLPPLLGERDHVIIQ